MDQRNQATYRAITGGRSPRTETTSWSDALAIVVSRIGSVAGAARVLDVPRRTLRRWLAGESQPSAERRRVVQGAVRRLERRQRLTGRRETRLRGATTVRVQGVDRYDGAERDVIFRIGGRASIALDAGTLDALVDRFLQGGSADDGGATAQNSGLFGELVDGMQDRWYRDFFRATDRDWGCDVYAVTIK